MADFYNILEVCAVKLIIGHNKNLTSLSYCQALQMQLNVFIYCSTNTTLMCY